MSERRAYVRAALDVAEDFSDGAFWGYMQEMGIDPDEVIGAPVAARTEGAEVAP